MFTGQFWKDAAERVIATFAQSYAASAVVLGGIFDVKALEVAIGAAILALFKSIAASQVGDKESASLTV
jgi:hypothetical protein